jgi:hypothetical protein
MNSWNETSDRAFALQHKRLPLIRWSLERSKLAGERRDVSQPELALAA